MRGVKLEESSGLNSACLHHLISRIVGVEKAEGKNNRRLLYSREHEVILEEALATCGRLAQCPKYPGSPEY